MSCHPICEGLSATYSNKLAPCGAKNIAAAATRQKRPQSIRTVGEPGFRDGSDLEELSMSPTVFEFTI
jgi:hypothetical protein